MAVTLTIKQVPERVAERLRARAAGNHRSLQGELMAMLEAALEAPANLEQPKAAYQVRRARRTTTAELPMHGRRLTLAELWELSKRIGPPSKRESTAIIRKMRDERYGR
ncbi:MAG TPA: Arc family DNA-binding protein [Burkholderiales bacterium]|nr:Arc family DNA-binding protein [Burkholderiales bacterium]